MTVHIHSSLAAASIVTEAIATILFFARSFEYKFFSLLIGFPLLLLLFQSLSFLRYYYHISNRHYILFPTILCQGSMVLSQAPSDESSGYDRETIAKRDAKRRFVSYLWDTLDKPYEERRLLFKLDAALLSFASLGG